MFTIFHFDQSNQVVEVFETNERLISYILNAKVTKAFVQLGYENAHAGLVFNALSKNPDFIFIPKITLDQTQGFYQENSPNTLIGGYNCVACGCIEQEPDKEKERSINDSSETLSGQRFGEFGLSNEAIKGCHALGVNSVEQLYRRYSPRKIRLAWQQSNAALHEVIGLYNQFERSSTAPYKPVKTNRAKRNIETKNQGINEVKVTDFELTKRSKNALRAASITTVQDLIQMTNSTIETMANVGRSSFAEITNLRNRILTLTGSPLASELPEEIATIGLRELEMSVRTKNVFNTMGVYSLEDFLKTELAVFMGQYGIGKESIKEFKALKTTFNKLKANDEAHNYADVPQPPVGTLPNTNPLRTNLFLLEFALVEFEFSVRAQTCFEAMDLVKLKDLMAVDGYELLKARNLGRKTLKEISDFKSKVVIATTVTPENDRTIKDLFPALLFPPQENGIDRFGDPVDAFSIAGHLTIAEYWGTVVLQDYDKGIEILTLRSGFGQQRQTLEQIGQNFGVTRERIRQIEAKKTRSMLKELAVFKAWKSEVSHYTHQSDRTLTNVEDLAGSIKAMEDYAENIDFYRYWLGQLFRERNVIEINSKYFLERFNQGQIDQSIAKVEKSINQKCIGMTAMEATRLLANIGHDQGAIEAVFQELSDNFIWTIGSRNDDQLAGYTKKITAPLAVKKIMMEALEPISNEDFLEQVKTQFPHLEGRNVLNRCGDETGVYPFSQRTKGTIEHIPIPKEKHQHLIDELKSHIKVFDGEQFHSRDLLPRISAVYTPRLNEFTLTAFIRHYQLHNYLGRNVFGPLGESRITIRDLIIDILRDRGDRMHSSEILEIVQETRSLPSIFQIHEKPPIKLLGDNYFVYDPSDT